MPYVVVEIGAGTVRCGSCQFNQYAGVGEASERYCVLFAEDLGNPAITEAAPTSNGLSPMRLKACLAADRPEERDD